MGSHGGILVSDFFGPLGDEKRTEEKRRQQPEAESDWVTLNIKKIHQKTDVLIPPVYTAYICEKENGQPRINKPWLITLWWTNIAMEHHHFLWENPL